MLFIIISLVLLALVVGSWRMRGGTERNDIPHGMVITARAVTGVIFALWLLWSSVLVVSVGSVSVATIFGTVEDQTYAPGMHLVNPLYSFHDMSVQRQIIEFQSGGSNAQSADDKGKANDDDVVAVSNDNLPLTIDVTYAFQLNPTYASWLYRNIGDQDKIWQQLVVQAARAATRSATARFNYQQATTTERDLLAKAMEDDFRSRLVTDLVRMGMPKDQADRVFTILPVQLRKVLPPEKVLGAIAEKAASEQDLQRQTILTNIAAQEAIRRGQEGSGVKKLFEQLPAGFSSTQIADVLHALGYKERSDAMLKAVETGKVSVIVMDGGQGTSLNVGGK